MKANIRMEKEMEKEKNIIERVVYHLKGNFYMEKNGMEKWKNLMKDVF